MEDYIRKLSGCRVEFLDTRIRYVARNVEDLQRLNFKQGDIFLVTYPKCGTHWMTYIIWGILHKGEMPPDLNKMKYGNLFPQLENTGTMFSETMESPRTFRTHLPSDLVPYSPKAKYIHVTRNPLDCCLSYYNYVKIIRPEIYGGVTLDQFFDDFVKGYVVIGDYFKHVLGWHKHKDDDNYLYITYEEMIKDHSGSILKVAKFLGDDYYRVILNDEELLEKIRYHSSFSFMKSLPMPRSIKDHISVEKIKEIMGSGENVSTSDDEVFFTEEMVNKGQVGLFKTTFSEEQQQKMRKKMKEELRNTEFLHQWEESLQDS